MEEEVALTIAASTSTNVVEVEVASASVVSALLPVGGGNSGAAINGGGAIGVASALMVAVAADKEVVGCGFTGTSEFALFGLGQQPLGEDTAKSSAGTSSSAAISSPIPIPPMSLLFNKDA